MNYFWAFCVGGGICVVGQLLIDLTGALMSQTTFLQKESIPAIAHLVELRSPQQKEENG